MRARKNGQIVVFWPINLTLTEEDLTLIGQIGLILTDFAGHRPAAAQDSIASFMQRSVKISSTRPISVSKQEVRDGNTAFASEVSAQILFHGVGQS